MAITRSSVKKTSLGKNNREVARGVGNKKRKAVISSRRTGMGGGSWSSSMDVDDTLPRVTSSQKRGRDEEDATASKRSKSTGTEPRKRYSLKRGRDDENGEENKRFKSTSSSTDKKVQRKPRKDGKPRKQRYANQWVRALKVWNSGKSEWCVPRKGTKDYNEVKSMMSLQKEKYFPQLKRKVC